SGDEHQYGSRVERGDHAGHLHTRQSGHVDVGEHGVHGGKPTLFAHPNPLVVGTEETQCLRGVDGGEHLTDVRVRLQAVPQLGKPGRLVVDGQDEQLRCVIRSTHSETHPAACKGRCPLRCRANRTSPGGSRVMGVDHSPKRDHSERWCTASNTAAAGEPTPNFASSGFFGSATTISASGYRCFTMSRRLPRPSTSPSSRAFGPSHTSPLNSSSDSASRDPRRCFTHSTNRSCNWVCSLFSHSTSSGFSGLNGSSRDLASPEV